MHKKLPPYITPLQNIQTVRWTSTSDIDPPEEPMIIKKQAGFRPGKFTTDQALNLTKHIENGYQNKMYNRVVFLHLTAAYDMVSHQLGNTKLCRVIREMLTSSGFYVVLETHGCSQQTTLYPRLQPRRGSTTCEAQVRNLCIQRCPK